MNLIYKDENNKIQQMKIIFGYKFNTEYIKTGDINYKNLICLIVEDDLYKVLIEYYINLDINLNIVLWHGYYKNKGKFHNLLLNSNEGDTFTYRKPQYEYTKLTTQEINKLVLNKIYDFEV